MVLISSNKLSRKEGKAKSIQHGRKEKHGYRGKEYILFTLCRSQNFLFSIERYSTC